MLLKTIEYNRCFWDAYVGPARESPTQLEVIFLIDSSEADRETAYAWPVDDELLAEMLREPLDVREDFLAAALARAIAGERRSVRGYGPVRLI